VNRNSSEILRVFFDIKQEDIDRDLKLADDDFGSFAAEMRSMQAIPVNKRTPEIAARLLHLGLVQTHVLCRAGHAEPEIQTFFAERRAVFIAQHAEDRVASGDTCSQILPQCHAIERREGVGPHDWDTLSSGPQDFRELCDEFGSTLERTVDTVMPYVLRRYHLEVQADLYEQDRPTFDFHVNVGQRVVLPACDAADRAFLREHGPETYERMIKRVQEIREFESQRRKLL